MDTVDRERAAFIKNYFHTEWPNRAVYHAMINTAMGEEAVVEAILSFMKQDKLQKSAANQPIADQPVSRLSLQSCSSIDVELRGMRPRSPQIGTLRRSKYKV